VSAKGAEGGKEDINAAMGSNRGDHKHLRNCGEKSFTEKPRWHPIATAVAHTGPAWSLGSQFHTLKGGPE